MVKHATVFDDGGTIAKWAYGCAYAWIESLRGGVAEEATSDSEQQRLNVVLEAHNTGSKPSEEDYGYAERELCRKMTAEERTEYDDIFWGIVNQFYDGVIDCHD